MNKDLTTRSEAEIVAFSEGFVAGFCEGERSMSVAVQDFINDNEKSADPPDDFDESLDYAVERYVAGDDDDEPENKE